MKIVSLQSVGLGAAFPSLSYEGINEPYVLKVGEKLKDGRGEELGVTVTEINYQQGDFDTYGFEIYTVHTSDGHIRVLPADKYIAEWSEDTNRISPDNPEETIEIVPNMKWFVRSKKRDGNERFSYIRDVLTTQVVYGFSLSENLDLKEDNPYPFETEDEANLWTNPNTEAVQLPVEDE